MLLLFTISVTWAGVSTAVGGRVLLDFEDVDVGKEVEGFSFGLGVTTFWKLLSTSAVSCCAISALSLLGT